MPADVLDFHRTTFLFLVALTRATAVLIPLGIPGLQRIPGAPKIVLALLLAAIILPYLDTPIFESLWREWRRAPLTTSLSIIVSELILGVCLGITVALLIESISWAMHLVGLNAGYSFASTFDPNSEADSTVLPVLGQLLGGLLFFASGLDRQLISALVLGLQGYSPGWASQEELAGVLSDVGSRLCTLSLRLSLPIIGLLALVDLGMALVNRIHAHLNLISITFPLKMLLALFLVASLVSSWSTVVQREASAWSQKILAAAVVKPSDR